MIKKDLADFIFIEHDWLYKKYKHIEFMRSHKYLSFKTALNLFLQRNGYIIVETGTQREKDDPSGCSTTFFGDICKKYDKYLYTVDNNEEHMKRSKGFTEEFKDYITYVLLDSVEFLRMFNKPIDLLYLDSMDCPLQGNATKAQKHQLAELIAAEDKLHVGSILLLDDNNFLNGGKTRLTKQYLVKSKKWRCIIDGGQSLWEKIG